jgi:hypothetical protein
MPSRRQDGAACKPPIIAGLSRPFLLGVYSENQPMPKTRYIRCKVAPGFFETEYYVMLQHGSSAYVDRSQVKVANVPEQGSETEGQVLAYVLDEAQNEALVELSGEPAVGGLRSWVSKALFVPASTTSTA